MAAELKTAGKAEQQIQLLAQDLGQQADFEAKLAKLTQSIKESRGKAGDLDSLKSIVTNINQNCDNCHEAYQVRNQ